jgi:Na+/H+ antiporter NhaD/arsenite permease-like protein
MGAVLLMIIAKQDPEEVFKTVEWKTLFFFIGLFILVEGVVEAGVIKIMADKALMFTQGSLKLTSIFILWLSAVASAIVDNIPYTATLIPMIQDELIPNLMSMNPELSQNTVSYALWWALSLGACLGGNGTLVGASANVVAASIASKSGHEISFMRFLKYGVLVTFLTVAVSNVYLLIRYL